MVALLVMLAVLAVGVVLLMLSGSFTRRRVRAVWADVDETTMNLSPGIGIVPSWISLVDLLSWLGIAVGGIGAFIVAIN